MYYSDTKNRINFSNVNIKVAQIFLYPVPLILFSFFVLSHSLYFTLNIINMPNYFIY